MITEQSVVVFCTCPAGEELAKSLVEQQLAACVNILPQVQSIYRWEGVIAQEQEQLLIIKTTLRAYPALEQAIRAQHPYAVPEIIALPVTQGYAPYLAWITESIGDSR